MNKRTARKIVRGYMLGDRLPSRRLRLRAWKRLGIRLLAGRPEGRSVLFWSELDCEAVNRPGPFPPWRVV